MGLSKCSRITRFLSLTPQTLVIARPLQNNQLRNTFQATEFKVYVWQAGRRLYGPPHEAVLALILVPEVL